MSRQGGSGARDGSISRCDFPRGREQTLKPTELQPRDCDGSQFTRPRHPLAELAAAILGEGHEDRDLVRFPCPVCFGGFHDPIWRPLVITDDGRVWCDAAVHGYEGGCWLTGAAHLINALILTED